MELKLGSKVRKPMKLALTLAEEGRYTISPLPMVGAVLLNEEHKLIGYGYNTHEGSTLAEIKALSMTKKNAKNSILYINFEPTKSTMDKVIKSGIKEIHIAKPHPDKIISSNTINAAKNAGIKVILGECKAEAEKQNAVFLHYLINKRPFVLASWAMSLDGKIATEDFQSRWISGVKSREHAHLFRNAFDAILVGTNTAKYDNPRLNVRFAKVACIKNPLKLVIDREGKLEETIKLFTMQPKKTYVIISNRYPAQKKKRLVKRGVNFIQLPESKSGLSLNELLNKLGEMSVTSLLVEGGAATLASFLKENLIDAFHCYIAPKVISGKNSITPFGANIGINDIKDAKKAVFEKVETIGDDILIKGRFVK